MKLIIGLGNLGDHFTSTRHNVGFYILDNLTNDWQEKAKFKAFISEQGVGDEKIIFAKPTTYYNLSGVAVRAIKDFYKLQNNDILVVHDELALPFGTVRVRLDGSDAGNNGIKSVIEQIGNDFSRLRVGIANEHSAKTDQADFVLAQFSHEEKAKLPEIANQAQDLINKFNSSKSLNPETIKI